MTLVYVIALLTALGGSKGLYTGPDGKVLTFESRDACQSAVLTYGLDKINVLGTHGKCKAITSLGAAKFQKKK